MPQVRSRHFLVLWNHLLTFSQKFVIDKPRTLRWAISDLKDCATGGLIDLHNHNDG